MKINNLQGKYFFIDNDERRGKTDDNSGNVSSIRKKHTQGARQTQNPARIACQNKSGSTGYDAGTEAIGQNRASARNGEAWPMCCQGERRKGKATCQDHYLFCHCWRREKNGGVYQDGRKERSGGMWRVWVVCGNGGMMLICGAVGVLAASAYVGKWCM